MADPSSGGERPTPESVDPEGQTVAEFNSDYFRLLDEEKSLDDLNAEHAQLVGDENRKTITELGDRMQGIMEETPMPDALERSFKGDNLGEYHHALSDLVLKIGQPQEGVDSKGPWRTAERTNGDGIPYTIDSLPNGRESYFIEYPIVISNEKSRDCINHNWATEEPVVTIIEKEENPAKNTGKPASRYEVSVEFPFANIKLPKDDPRHPDQWTGGRVHKYIEKVINPLFGLAEYD